MTDLIDTVLCVIVPHCMAEITMDWFLTHGEQDWFRQKTSIYSG